MKKKKWSPYEEKFIRENINTMTNSELAVALNRNMNSISRIHI